MDASVDVLFVDGQTIVGVDGCRAGWVAVYRDGRELAFRIHEDIQALMGAHCDPDLVFIDVPIGLPWQGCVRRPCDVLARQELGRDRSPSVFSPPCRSAANAVSLEEARKLNVANLGRSLSAQAWGICRKVAEVDAWLLQHPDHRPRLLEVHPEVCFWALNGRRPMRHRKSRREGREERLKLLARLEPGIRKLLDDVLAQTRRAAVEADDVLDAAAAMLTGSLQQGPLLSLQGTPASDDHGLPMQMLFRHVSTC